VKQAVLRCLSDNQPGRILDIPSGSCWLSDHLDESSWEYYAADLYAGSSVGRFRKVDLNEPLSYDDAFFDYVVCLEGLEHIENYHRVLRDFQRILRPGGKLIISTPNPLNIASRMRFLSWGTFFGFPHLISMPAKGKHLHMSPINLSFLVSFAQEYGMPLEQVHPIAIRKMMYRYVLHVAVIRAHVRMRLLFKDQKTRRFIMRLHSWNVLLNDEMVVSFVKT
jgi:2-polyprenyl-3-methyl-5-hydroxy-6-metoxy-1,4-benzoquinol methylase